MDRNKKFINGEGGYVFISHSHQDIEKVRKIRNEMEDQGFEPLCFYLKCLTDDDEVEGLIKREIDAREYFVYVDSKNARNSKWVQKERAYIKSTGNKKVFVIDLDKNDDAKDITNRILSSMRVFLSYSKRDKKIVSKIYRKLLDKDMKVFYDNGYSGNSWSSKTADELRAAAEHGCVVFFLSKESMESDHIVNEIALAKIEKGLIIPVLVDYNENDLPAMYEYMFRHTHVCKISSDAAVHTLEEFVEYIGKTMMDKFYQQ